MQFPNIEAERKKSGLSKTQLAQEIGVSLHILKNWQSGRAEIPASKIVSLANLFGVTTDYLLVGHPAMRPNRKDAPYEQHETSCCHSRFWYDNART